MEAKTTTRMSDLEFARMMVEALGGNRWQARSDGLSLDIGSHGWRWPGGSVSYNTEQNARQHAPVGWSREELAVGPQYSDNRLTILDVKRMIARAEREAFMRTNDIPAAEALDYVGGPWNEYLNSALGVDDSEPWPTDAFIAVFIHPGGNEGIQLRVQTVEEKPKVLLYGKSLGISWSECAASAGRISAMLNQ